MYKTLALVLAAGKGSRVEHLLTEDESVKVMIRINDNRLIDIILDSLNGLNMEKAVLSFPSELYVDLDRRVKERNVRIIKQKARHRKLPYLLELPNILVQQYHFSSDREYLQSFDSIMTLPCDKVLREVDLEDMLRFHYEELQSQNERQITLLSRLGEYPACRVELFKMEGNRITARKRYEGYPINGYEITSQAGVYIFSRETLRTPITSLAALVFGHLSGNFRNIKILRYLTKGEWVEYGRDETLRKLRS